jgi:hypothetical protein
MIPNRTGSDLLLLLSDMNCLRLQPEVREEKKMGFSPTLPRFRRRVKLKPISVSHKDLEATGDHPA